MPAAATLITTSPLLATGSADSTSRRSPGPWSTATFIESSCQQNVTEMSADTKSLRVAELVQSGRDQHSAIERAPGVYESRGVGNSYLLTTLDGDVLVNAGTLGDARRGCELFRQVSSAPLRYIILT